MVTVKEMRNAAVDHDAKKDTDWEESGNPGVGIFGEKIIPLVKDIAEAVGDQDSKRQKDKNGRFGAETREDDSKNDEAAGDRVTRSEEAFGSREQADDSESDRGEADERRKEGAFERGTPRKERQEGSLEVAEEATDLEIFGEEKFADDGRVDNSGHDEESDSYENDKSGDDKRDDGQGFDCEAKMGVEKSEEDDKNGEVDEVGSENRGEEDEGKDEAIERFRLSDALDFGAEPEQQGGPKNKHDERSARAGEIEERGRKNGKNRSEQGDVVFEPAVEQEYQ